MSSMEIDPLTGMPKQKKQPAYTQAQVQASLAANPQSTFGPSPNVNYGFGTLGNFQPPGMPDYAGLINNDPLYKQLQADLSAGGVQDAASRAALTQRALIQFGQVPSFDALAGLNPAWINQDVNDQTRQLAQQNTSAGLSLAARQQDAFNKQIKQIKNALAARGALQSGEFSHQLQEAQTGYDRAKYDSNQELLDFLSGLQAGFAQQERARQGQLSQGAEAAAGRVAQANPAPVVPAGGDPLAPIIQALAAAVNPPKDPRPTGGGGGGGQPYMVI